MSNRINNAINLIGTEIINTLQDISTPIIATFDDDNKLGKKKKGLKYYYNENNDYIYETYFIIEFQNETFEFEFALDQVSNNQLMIVDVFAYKCFGHEIPTYH